MPIQGCGNNVTPALSQYKISGHEREVTLQPPPLAPPLGLPFLNRLDNEVIEANRLLINGIADRLMDIV